MSEENLFLEKKEKKKRSASMDQMKRLKVVKTDKLSSPKYSSPRSKNSKQRKKSVGERPRLTIDPNVYDPVAVVIEPLLATDERQCFVCEQTVKANDVICPHCKRSTEVVIDDVEDEEPYFSQTVKRLKDMMKNGKEGAREEYLNYLFDVAMKLRRDPEQTQRMIKLLKQIISLDEKQYEARLKLSYRYVLESDWEKVVELLLPVVEESEATLLQRQRAYTNISCAYHFDLKKGAERFSLSRESAKAGIDLDGIGSFRLWENYAIACEGQRDFEEALDGLRRSYMINPLKESKENITRLETKIKKIQKKQSKGSKSSRRKKKKSLVLEIGPTKEVRRVKSVRVNKLTWEDSGDVDLEILDF